MFLVYNRIFCRMIVERNAPLIDRILPQPNNMCAQELKFQYVGGGSPCNAIASIRNLEQNTL